MANTCLICGSESSPKLVEKYSSDNVDYSLFECGACGAQFWTPFKNPGGEWYEKDERHKGANKNPVMEPTWNHKKILEFLSPLKGRVLDIGCGTGNFLYLAKNIGWEVSGIDFDRNAVNTAKTLFKLPGIELATLGEYTGRHQGDARKYNLVTFFDVFEHIDNHKQFTEEVKSILAPGGYVAMSMPYRNGARWLQPHDLPPRHLTRWSRKPLKNFFEQNGFDVLYIKRNPASFFNIVMKLRFKYGKTFSFNLVKTIQDNKSDIVAAKKADEVFAAGSRKTQIIHTLAKIKDLCLFGAPALFIWLYFWVTGGIYTGLFAIVRKRPV